MFSHILWHVVRHMPDRHVLEHMPDHMLEHVTKHVPDRHVPEHVLTRHVLGHELGKKIPTRDIFFLLKFCF